MTRKDAAWRGAFLGALWAAALLMLLAAVRTTSHARGPLVAAYSLFTREWWLNYAGPVAVIASSVTAAALVGSALGLLARRMAGPPRRRAVLLALASVPGLYLVVLVALTLILLPTAQKEGLLAFLGMTTGGALYGMPIVLPVAAAPTLLFALMLEGATRSDDQRHGGFANAAVQRWVPYVLVGAVAVSGAVAALRWPAP